MMTVLEVWQDRMGCPERRKKNRRIAGVLLLKGKGASSNKMLQGLG